MKPLIPNGKELDFAPYIITEDGRVYSKWRNRELKPNTRAKGYKYQYIVPYDKSKARFYCIHRLVAMLYIPNPDNKPEVNHKDGNPSNNHVNNLEWMTHKENIQHAFDVLGRKNKYKTGKDNPRYGMKQSKETRDKQAKAKLGELHPKFKGYYIYEGKEYNSYQKLADYLNTYVMKVRRMHLKGLISFKPKE